MAETIKERSIIFSAPMVSAILDGKKTQTRRIAKSIGIVPGIGPVCNGSDNIRDWPQFCQYGKPGDMLWVRETYCKHGALISYKADDDWIAEYRKSSDFNVIDNPKWEPSIYMPRIASRITLEITDIRVEQLQDISEEDALAEGVNICAPYVGVDCEGNVIESDIISWMPSDYYRELWESINGKGSWDLNPWVWVIQFKRI